jgi:hypothetical protein
MSVRTQRRIFDSDDELELDSQTINRASTTAPLAPKQTKKRKRDESHELSDSDEQPTQQPAIDK